MRITAILQVLTIVLASAVSAAAQEPAVPKTPQDEKKDTSFGKKISTAIVSSLKAPVHPIIKGIAPGGGLGVGIEAELPARGRWESSTTALVTTQGYWSTAFETGYLGVRRQLHGYARLRDMTQLNFFAPGIASDLGSRTTFRLRDFTLGTLATASVTEWLTVGGRVEQLWPDVGSGRHPRVPSIDERFAEMDAPGLTAQPRFGRYQTFVEVDVPPGPPQAFHQGGRYRLGYGIYHDQQFNRFTFRRFDVEGQERFTVLGPHRRLTLHAWASASDTSSGHDVPFYLQRTLGGKGNLRSVHEELIGSDGTPATLRGFHNFRFHDRNLLLLQAEYRVPVWGPFDATVFVDAGKVTNRASDLFNGRNLKRNYGFSGSVMRGASSVARMDVGFGGGEGVRLFVSFGGDFR